MATTSLTRSSPRCPTKSSVRIKSRRSRHWVAPTRTRSASSPSTRGHCKKSSDSVRRVGRPARLRKTTCRLAATPCSYLGRPYCRSRWFACQPQHTRTRCHWSPGRLPVRYTKYWRGRPKESRTPAPRACGRILNAIGRFGFGTAYGSAILDVVKWGVRGRRLAPCNPKGCRSAARPCYCPLRRRVQQNARAGFMIAVALSSRRRACRQELGRQVQPGRSNDRD